MAVAISTAQTTALSPDTGKKPAALKACIASKSKASIPSSQGFELDPGMGCVMKLATMRAHRSPARWQRLPIAILTVLITALALAPGAAAAVYNLPKSGTSHPSGNGTDLAYAFHGPYVSTRVCVEAHGSIGGKHTTKTKQYFNLFHKVSGGWSAPQKYIHDFPLDGANHTACWSNFTADQTYAVGWTGTLDRINTGTVVISYTEYAS